MRLSLLFEYLSKNDPQHQEFYRFLKKLDILIRSAYHHIYAKIESRPNFVAMDLSTDGESNWDSDDQVMVDVSAAEPKRFGVAEANHWKFYLVHEIGLIPKLERALKIVNYLIKYEKENPHKINDKHSLLMVEGAKRYIFKTLTWLRMPTDKNITLQSFKDFLSNLWGAGVWVSDYVPVDAPRYPLNTSWATDKDGNQVPTVGA